MNGNDSAPNKLSRTHVGIFISGITCFMIGGIYVVATPFLLPALRKYCLPYVPATSKQISNVMKALRTRSGTGSVVDLGSGDGRIVFAAAKAGHMAVGVELNFWLVLYSRLKARLSGLYGNVKFIKQDLLKYDLAPYDNVVIFGVEEMMQILEAKFEKELPCGSCVIACRFPLTTWKPQQIFGEGIDSVWLYKKNSNDVKENGGANKNNKKLI